MRRAGKLGRAVRGVNSRDAVVALLLCTAGCVATFRDVPREGVNEFREFLGVPSRAPSAASTPDTAPAIAWRVKGLRGSVASLAVGERITLATTTDKFLYAIDTRTGAALWRHRVPNTLGVGAVMGGGRAYAAMEGADGAVVGVSLRNGRRRWTTRVGDVGAPLVLRDSTLFVGTQSGTLAALRTDNGRRRWVIADVPTLSGPLVHDGRVILVTLHDSLIVADARDGRLLRRAGIGTSTHSALTLIDDSTVAFSASGREVVAVSIPGGIVRWRAPLDGDPAGSPVVRGDTLWSITNQCTLWTIPIAEPARASADTIGCLTRATPLLVRDGVVVATVDGRLLYYRRAERRVVWTRDIGSESRHPPLLQDGQLIVAPTRGPVVSFR